jgi:hypothetical protein
MSVGVLAHSRPIEVPIYLSYPVLLFDAIGTVGPSLQVEIIVRVVQLWAGGALALANTVLFGQMPSYFKRINKSGSSKDSRHNPHVVVA